MASDSQLDLIMDTLTKLADYQFESDFYRAGLRDQYLDGVIENWHKFGLNQEKAAGEEERQRNEAALEKERKEFEKQIENLAKALPNVTKGVLNAVTAFQRNDPFTGSAALMDICASVTPLIAGLSAAGGPPGMIVGAIFSMFSQILSIFAPAAKSLSDQINGVLTTLKADDNEQKIGAVQDDIRTYTIALRRAMLETNNLLDGPKSTDRQFAEDMATKAGVLATTVGSLNPNAITSLWEVARWLREGKNQGEDKWPLVLAAWCQAYSDLLFTAALVRVLANTDGMRRRFDEAGSLKRTDRTKLEDALRNVRIHASAMLIKQEATATVAGEHLRNLIRPAQDRGLLWQIDASSGLFGGSQIQRGKFAPLGAQGKKVAVAASEQDLETSIPTYHVFHLEPGKDGRLYHGLSTYPYKTAPEWHDLGETVKGLTDIWATTGAGLDPKEIYFHGTKGTDIIGYVLDKDGKVRDGNYRLTLKSEAIAVRVVRDPSWRTDDPDLDPAGPGLQGQPYLLYGGCAASEDVFVATEAEGSGYVPSPWTHYRGLGVDDTYLWVFGSGGFACATHASVMRCLKKEIPKPRWMTHYPNELIYHSAFSENASKIKDAPPLRGLLSLSPCDDGTLVAAIAMRTAMLMPQTMQWTAFDSPKAALYTGVYKPDLKTGTVQVAWTKLPETTTADVVQKVPVPCWPILESLNESLPQFARILQA